MMAVTRDGSIHKPLELSDKGLGDIGEAARLWAAVGQWLGTLAALLAMAPAWAQESLSVKELLDRAQTKPQTEAVAPRSSRRGDLGLRAQPLGRQTWHHRAIHPR